MGILAEPFLDDRVEYEDVRTARIWSERLTDEQSIKLEQAYLSYWDFTFRLSRIALRGCPRVKQDPFLCYDFAMDILRDSVLTYDASVCSMARHIYVGITSRTTRFSKVSNRYPERTGLDFIVASKVNHVDDITSKDLVESIRKITFTDLQNRSLFIINSYMLGYTLKEIANMMGVSSNTIDRRWSNIKKKIKMSLEVTSG